MGKMAGKEKASQNEPKRGRGQPSGYKVEYGEEIIGLMERGFSLTAAAAKVGFSKQTIYNWMEAHTDFFDAMQRAKGLRQFFLEDKLLSTKNGAEVNAAKWALACAFPDDWRERREVEVTVNGSLAQRLEAASAALAQMEG